MIQGGTNYNVLPSEVHLKLTIRVFSMPIYQQIVTAIRRICNAEAAASGLPVELFPVLKEREHFTKPLTNDGCDD